MVRNTQQAVQKYEAGALGESRELLRVMGISGHHTSTRDHPRIMCQVRKKEQGQDSGKHQD